MNAPRERMLRVGHGLFDPLSGELSLDGGAVKLRPRTAAVLAHLLQHSDRVVSKNELMQAVWPDVVVTEDSLVQCVKEIRHAFGRDGRDWIRTLPRQGYAFVGNRPDGSEPDGQEGPPASSAPVPLPSQRAVAARWRRTTAFALLAFVVAGAFALRGWQIDRASRSPAPPLSIVVMPVVNATGDAAQENTADEITEALADALARTSGTAVIAPGTVFTFKGKPVDVRRLGAELNVRYVLQGSLKLEASLPVLTMRLADASTAVQLWNQEFRPGAVTELRDLVAGRVASTLGLQLMRAETRRGTRQQAASPEAIELVSQARAVLRWSGKGAGSMAQARRLLQDALRHDESLADAWATLAFTYLNDVRFSASREADLRHAEQALERAVALAPDSDGVQYVAGWLAFEQGRTQQALISFQRATELNPNNVAALGFRGATLIRLGRPDEALRPVQQAMRLSPRDRLLPVWQMFAGVAHLHLGKDAAAVEQLTRSVEGYPLSPFGRLYLASALALSGRIPEAQAQMAQFQQLRPRFTLSRLRAVDAPNGSQSGTTRERIYEGLRRAGMPE